MNKQEKHIETLSEIRFLMERSSRFISLSGLAGVSAGIFALIGAVVAYLYLGLSVFGEDTYYEYAFDSNNHLKQDFVIFFLFDSLSVLILSVIFALYFTIRKAKKQGLEIWDKTTYRFLENLLMPMLSGGIFCLILLYHRQIALIAPSMLIFYGLTLLNCSKYTLDDIRYLGILEIILGLISAVFLGYGLLFWAIGFGLLHIIYGTLMYFKYEVPRPPDKSGSRDFDKSNS